MARRTIRPKAPKQASTLYIGQWIRALGQRQIDVVKATGINEGYLSELINGGKWNPTYEMIMRIAEYLQIPVHYFNRPPPDREFLAEAAGIDPEVLNRLVSSKKH